MSQTFEDVSDREVRHEIWSSSIPISINVAAHEVVSLSSPMPYYTMIPRQSYFMLLIQEVKEYFEEFVSSFGSSGGDYGNVWFEFDGTPLKWHIPAGVLYDLFSMKYKKLNQSDISLPWKLTVHFQNFPSEKIIKCSNENDVKWNFVNALKESMQIRYRNTNSVMSMSNSDQSTLWNAVKQAKQEDFDKVRRQLQQSNSSVLRNYPIRIYTSDEFKEQRYPTLYSLARAEYETKTLADLVQQRFPGAEYDNCNVLLHGVKPSADTPLKWLVENCAYPDGFLYIAMSE